MFRLTITKASDLRGNRLVDCNAVQCRPSLFVVGAKFV